MLSVTSPFLPCTSTTIDPNDPPLITFDDVLDIAREFEFTSTITYIAELDETNPISWEYLFSTRCPTEKTEERPIPTSISRLTLDHGRVQECEWQMLTHPSPDLTESTSSEASETCQSSPLLEMRQDLVSLQMNDEFPAILLGWCPPDGSQFLELDDDLLRTKALQDNQHPPWLAKILAPDSNPQQPQPQPTSSAIRPANDNQQSQKPAAGLQAPSTSRTKKEADNHRSKSLLAREQILPPRALPRVKAEPTSGPSESCNRTEFVVTPDGKPLRLRLHHPVAVPRKHASAPRGGIPPHIARSVTKANILRAEKEHKVTKASSKGSAGEGKKPSVLRTVVKGREPRKVINGGGGGKKWFPWDDEEWEGGRVAKRTRM